MQIRAVVGESIDRLRLHMDDRWTTDDFVATFRCVQQNYYLEYWSAWAARSLEIAPLWKSSGPPMLSMQPRDLAYFMDGIAALKGEMSLDAAFASAAPESRLYRLEVFAIRYGSPGWQDLTGMGKAFEAVADLVKKVLDYKADAKKKEVEIELAKADLERKRIENAHARLSVFKSFGASDRDLAVIARRTLFWDQQVTDLVIDGKIVGVEQTPLKQVEEK